MKLITEKTENVKVLLEAGVNGTKNYYIEGVFLQGDIKNRNGRCYPVDILQKEVSRYNTEYILAERALGELGHPEGPQINLDRVSHKIISMKQHGSDFHGRAKILDTPMGKIAKNLIDEGVKLGVSSRGLGTLEERNGINYVRPDFQLATAADIVADPSAPSAFVKGIMEGAEWVYMDGMGWVNNFIDSTRKKLKKMPNSRINEEKKLELFKKFLQEISKPNT